MKPSDIFQNSREATPEELRQFWTQANDHDRKLLINMAFNNSNGSKEKVITFLAMVDESDTQTYLDHYDSLKHLKG